MGTRGEVDSRFGGGVQGSKGRVEHFLAWGNGGQGSAVRAGRRAGVPYLKGMNDAPRLTVLHDGSCPLCAREIAVYRAADRDGTLAFHDVSSDDAGTEAHGLSRQAAMARFHVVTAEGRTLSGAAAFIALWRALPGWRWLGRVASLPGVPWLLERAYGAFLPLRPALQRLVRRLERGREQQS